ncbi:ABC transporter ATP-binding protein [Lacrimispora defluvii]|uniref:ABC transporter ATP-binding protein n=1 Tax=Lacrimispora defluvii TaxID=2719233 RepID=A0ABX1VYA2_9FIRM|nr:ABC transporter ATP-binding protein [Lacrimispora defluvii]NNJ32827.1 ABC transporter ATP-binding protein [Lacrimispora defluvii]
MNNLEYKIVVSNVSKSYKMYNNPIDKMKEGLSLTGKNLHTNFWALKNVDFQVERGEILGIMGRNGAGKSTLLKIITGVLRPTYGEVLVEGRISSLLELGAGFNMEYSGIENIYFYGMLMKLTREQIDDRLQEIIDFAEIGDYVNQPVKTYSSGMFARLAFSCAINVEPDILIVDEILSVGDMRFQSKCFNKFKEFKKKGVTILYVGHDVGLMKTFCDSTIWMNNGEIEMTGDPAYVVSKYTEFMYLDDISEFTTYKMFQKDEKKTGVNNRELMNSGDETTNKKFNLKNESVEKIEEKIGNNSITHWGTHVGMVKCVMLADGNDIEKTYFSPEDIIKIKVVFDSTAIENLKKFSVAFSIKNKEGTDLIVKSTYDEEIYFNSPKKKQFVTFSLVTHLAVGEYYLVIALEDRKNPAIMYYEYIEGAKYFKIYSDKKIFGIVDMKTDIKIESME